ncbi:hypothetical protein BDV93DRAFT_580054 [Ceratobasidium sp. AG-I]|nr:hypothetical protein BDV93DRAFT_580054 [Ceratobasidium sp. AG-I]
MNGVVGHQGDIIARRTEISWARVSQRFKEVHTANNRCAIEQIPIAPGRTRMPNEAVYILGINDFGRGVVTGVGLTFDHIRFGVFLERPDGGDTGKDKGTEATGGVLHMAEQRGEWWRAKWKLSSSRKQEGRGHLTNASNKGKGKAPAKKRQHDDSDEVDGDDISEPEPPQKRPRKETARPSTQFEATSKKTLQHNRAYKSRQCPPNSSNNDGSPPGSPSTPDRGRASPTGWPGSRAGSCASSHASSRDGSRGGSPAGSRAGPRAHSNASPAKHSPPPSSTRQPNESLLQGGAGSNREHGGCNEAEDAPIPGSRQNDAGRNAREEDEEASVAPRRTGLRATAGLAAAVLVAADGAAEDDDTARKSSGGSKKGGKAKAKAKPKP